MTRPHPPRPPYSGRPASLPGPFAGWYRTQAQADAEAEALEQASVVRDTRLNLWERLKVVVVLALAVVVLLAVLPPWLLLVLLVVGGVHLHRKGTGSLRRALGPLGRFLLFDNRPVEERTGVERFLTRDRTDPVPNADPATWISREIDLGRLPSPSKLQKRFPGIDPAVLGQYAKAHPEMRRERLKGRGMIAAAYAGQGALWVLNKATDADGSRRRGRIARREAEREWAIERHRDAETEYYERANRRARRGW